MRKNTRPFRGGVGASIGVKVFKDASEGFEEADCSSLYRLQIELLLHCVIQSLWHHHLLLLLILKLWLVLHHPFHCCHSFFLSFFLSGLDGLVFFIYNKKKGSELCLWALKVSTFGFIISINRLKVLNFKPKPNGSTDSRPDPKGGGECIRIHLYWNQNPSYLSLSLSQYLNLIF